MLCDLLQPPLFFLPLFLHPHLHLNLFLILLSSILRVWKRTWRTARRAMALCRQRVLRRDIFLGGHCHRPHRRRPSDRNCSFSALMFFFLLPSLFPGLGINGHGHGHDHYGKWRGEYLKIDGVLYVLCFWLRDGWEYLALFLYGCLVLFCFFLSYALLCTATSPPVQPRKKHIKNQQVKHKHSSSPATIIYAALHSGIMNHQSNNDVFVLFFPSAFSFLFLSFFVLLQSHRRGRECGHRHGHGA